MEAEHSEDPPLPSSTVFYPKQGRNATKLPKTALQRLQLRELGGAHRHHQNRVNNQIFQKLPGRLGFSLNNLVDETVLQEGHIFLGFSKNGQFVLSYTFHVEADEHTAYPIYVYRLQWWRFRPYKRLKKVSEVRLFGEEEIQQDLYIALCEWPSDTSRILVYGHCAPGDNEEKHQCFITITAVPPLEPCEDCSQLVILHSQSGFHSHMYDAPPRCLVHAFTVHTKYELCPPYPSFAPKIYLKMDGVLIVNTGDSLIAISTDIEDNHGGFGFGLYSPRVTRSMSNVSTVSSDDQVSLDSQDHTLEPKPFEELDNSIVSETVLGGVLAQSPFSNSAIPSSGSHTPTTAHFSLHVPGSKDVSQNVRERHTSSGKENLPSSPNIEANTSGTAVRHDTPNAKLHKAMDVYNFEGSTPKREEPEVGSTPGDVVPSLGSPNGRVRAALFPSVQQSARMSQNVTPEDLNFVQDTELSDEEEENRNRSSSGRQDVFQKPQDPTGFKLMTRDVVTGTSRTLSSLTLIPPDNVPIGKNFAAFSSGCTKFEQATGSSTCSSCVSSPIILQSESQCFTYSVRRYIEPFGRPESPVIDVEDDLNLAYHSVLPLEVHGANYCNMKLLTKQCLAPQMPCVVVKQLTLDVEHYLGETVRTTAEWGHRYLSFTDYDVQIVDVSPDTSEVIALVFVLIRARPPKDKKHVHGASIRAMPKLYQSGFTLIWNLQTGSYTTLDVDDLVEISQKEFYSGKRWQPGHRVCDTIQRRFAVPQTYSRTVNVLTNDAVFKGQSLKMLLSRQHYVAILL